MVMRSWENLSSLHPSLPICEKKKKNKGGLLWEAASRQPDDLCLLVETALCRHCQQ